MKGVVFGMSIMLACVGTANAQIPVTVTSDIPAWTNQVETMGEWAKTAKSWAEQAKSWGQQYNQMMEQYNAITGVRSFGDILNNRVLRRNVPDEWTGVYDTGGDAVLLGEQASRIADMRSIESKIRASERLVGTVDDDLVRVERRARDVTETNKAMAQAAYKRQPGMIQQIENLMGKINETTDAKGIAEMQARIGAEAAAQTWQTNNILLMAQLKQEEKDLANQQRIGLSQSIIGTRSTAIPSLGGE